MRVCAVIPAYNEAAHIAEVVALTIPLVDTVLVVDDGSADESGVIAHAAGAEMLVHASNQGKGASLRDGFDWACAHGFDAMVALDADGQHLPTELTGLVVVAEAGADLAVGNRMADVEDMPWLRLWTNRFTSWVVSLLAGVSIPDSQCGYRLLTARAWTLAAPHIRTANFDFESDMLIQAGRMGLRIVAVPVSTIYGDEESKISPWRDTIRFFSMVARSLVQRRPPRIEASAHGDNDNEGADKDTDTAEN